MDVPDDQHTRTAGVGPWHRSEHGHTLPTSTRGCSANQPSSDLPPLSLFTGVVTDASPDQWRTVDDEIDHVISVAEADSK